MTAPASIDPTSPRAAAEYLVRLRPLAAAATAARRAWVRSLREIADDLRRDAPLVRARAEVASRGRLRIFKELRAQLDELAPPATCQGCHLTLGRWFDRMIDSCEATGAFGAGGDATRLHEARAALTAANEYARGFNTDFAALVGRVREVTDAAVAARLPYARHVRPRPRGGSG